MGPPGGAGRVRLWQKVGRGKGKVNRNLLARRARLSRDFGEQLDELLAALRLVLPEILVHLLAGVHGAELGPAHRAEGGFLVVVVAQGLVMHRAGGGGARGGGGPRRRRAPRSCKR